MTADKLQPPSTPCSSPRHSPEPRHMLHPTTPDLLTKTFLSLRSTVKTPDPLENIIFVTPAPATPELNTKRRTLATNKNTLPCSLSMSRDGTLATSRITTTSRPVSATTSSCSMTGLSPVIEEQLSRQKSETYEVVDSDNNTFTFSIISDIINSEDKGAVRCTPSANGVKPMMRKTCKEIAKYIRWVYVK